MAARQQFRIVGAGIIALMLAGMHAASADAAKMTLTRPLKAAATATYKATIKASVQGMDVTLVQNEKQTVKSVKEDGTAIIESEDLGGTMSLNGQDQEQKPGEPTTETRDRLNRLVDHKHEEGPNSPFSPELRRLIAAVGDVIFTEKPVAEGDSWETQLDNPVSKPNKVKVKTTYLGTEKVAGQDLWKFKQVAEAIVNADGTKMVNESTVWINPQDAFMEKTDSKIKGVPTMFGPLDLDLAIQRVKTPAAADPKPAK